ncbi:MAG: hypothetical protein AWU54_786 [Candidatus Frackibacter sp. T328-2]|nr:MAG: hypothetical protein AWU54_786 [Candidatus Frackibacter sp. T328-2]
MKKIFSLLLIFFIIFMISPNVYALSFPFGEQTENIPGLMQPTKLLIDTANDIFKYGMTEFQESTEFADNLLNTDAMRKIGYQLLVLFFMANLYRKYENLGKLTLATIFPVLIFYGLGFALLKNIDLIFRFGEALTKAMINAINTSSSNNLFDFQIMLNKYNDIDFGALGLGFFVKVYYAVVFFIVGILCLISSVFVSVLLLIRQFKLLVLKLVAPIMIVGFSNPKTSRFSFNFVKKIVMVFLELFYLKAIISLFLAFMSTGSSFFMLIIMAVGLIVAIFGSPALLSFLK